MIIAIEGGDAVGKKTQATLLAQRLHGQYFASPDYGIATGRLIKDILYNKIGVCGGVDGESRWQRDDVAQALAFQALMITNRIEQTRPIEVLAAVQDVVLDRWHASAEVYGAAAGLDPGWLEEMGIALIQPDVYILIDLPVEEGFRRRPDRRDRHERDAALLERVRVGYLRLFEDRSRRSSRWRVVDGRGTLEEVAERITAVLPTAKTIALDPLGGVTIKP